MFKFLFFALFLVTGLNGMEMESNLPMQIHQNLKGISFATGYRILEEKNGAAIVGMSPGNSYFKRDVIASLLQTVQAHFSKIYIIVPDRPAIHTFTALGYSPDEAERLIRGPVKRIKRAIRQGLAILDRTHDISRIHVLDWQSEIESSPVYREKLAYVNELFRKNTAFRTDLHAVTGQVLAATAQKMGRAVSDDALDESTHYFLKEVAFLLASPAILQSDAVVNIYHKSWALWNNFASGHYDGKGSVVGDVVIS